MSNSDGKNGVAGYRKRKGKTHCGFCGCNFAEHDELREIIDSVLKAYKVPITRENRKSFARQMVRLIEEAIPESVEKKGGAS